MSAHIAAHERAHPRYASATSRDVAAGLSPTVTVNRSNQHASGTLSAPECAHSSGVTTSIEPEAIAQGRGET